MAQTLFNQPHPARAAVPWQPNAGIAKKLSSRGYATTSWTDDEPQAFADLGFAPKSSGFSAAHYQPTKQALSPQAKASLALLEDEYRNETLGEEKPASVAGTETNEHLPFVMDAYGATRKSKLRVNVAPSVLQRALAQAEMAESLVVSPITSDDKVADPIVIHPDVPDVEPLALDAASTDTAELAVTEPTEEPEAQEAAHEEDDTDAMAPQAPETPNGQDLETAQAAAAEPEPPALPAVVGGIDPEEVAQREAEQFAKGLAQAREEAQTQLTQAVEEARQEALAQGLAQGLEQGKTEGLAEGLAQGLEQGKAEGEAAARESMAEEIATHRVLFENVSHELGALMADSKKFFEPMKRLALHIAEQVVVGELQTSSQAIERLVQRCLDELDHPVHGAVVLELNPQDKELLQAQGSELVKGMRLEAVHDMQRGSVRVFANDTVVEDLVAHRLEGLVQALQVDAQAWQAHSALTQPTAQPDVEEVEGGDVHS